MKKKKFQKRHMYMTIKEAYGIFKIENPNVKIGLSTFAEIRSQNVLLSTRTPANVCTCIYHQNMFLALDAIHSFIPDIPSYNTDFLPPVYFSQTVVCAGLGNAYMRVVVLQLNIIF